jgi:hypothetical protein
MMRLRWTLLFAALAVFLTACPGPEIPQPAKISLVADPTSLPAAGGEVTLTVTVDEGTVTSVDFLADGTSVGTDGDGGDGFSVKYTVPANTATTAKTIKFVATGTAGSATVNSNEVDVTQAAAPNPGTSVAPDKTINTVAGIPTVSGIAATGLQAVAAEVTGVQGTVSTTVARAPTKGTVVIQAGTNQLKFTYTPNAGATGTDSFQYTAKNGNAAAATGTITLNLAKTVRAPNAAGTTLTNLNEAGVNEVVVVTGTGDIACAVDPCVNLENGQVILGNGTVTIGDVTLTNSAAKRSIVANMGVGDLATVIKLANDVTVQGINISSGANNAGNNIFRAITDFGGPLVTGAITLKDIDINMGGSTAASIDIGTEIAADRANTIVMDDVTVAGLNDGATGITIKSAGSVSIINVSPTVTVAYDVGNILGTGISIVGANTTIVLDGAAVTSAANDNDADPTNAPPSPAFTINKTGVGTTMSLTVKNTRTTVGATGTAFHLTGAGGPIAVQAGSTGNVVNPATAVRVVKTGAAGGASTGTIAP